MGDARRPEWTAVEENVRIGLDWVTNDQQPPTAMMSQFGKGEHVGGRLRVEVSAGHFGPGGGRPGVGLIAFEMPRYGDDAPPRFTQDEVDYLVSLVDRHPGVTVDRHWNGLGWHSLSVAFLGVAPSVAHAYANYGAMHRGERGASFGDLIPPAWIAVDWPATAAPAPPDDDDDRNLRAVQEALAAIRTVLADAGYHPDTIVAGRRGDIIDDDGRLAFDPKSGHGVCLPAEAAVALVQLLEGMELL